MTESLPNFAQVCPGAGGWGGTGGVGNRERKNQNKTLKGCIS